MLKIKQLVGMAAVSAMIFSSLAGCGSVSNEEVKKAVTEAEKVIEEIKEEAATEVSETEEAETVMESQGMLFEAEEGEYIQPDYEELDYDGYYTSVEEVALYLYTYGELPDNYITKNEAKNLGWVSSEGNLDEVAPGMSIGGDKFGNREGLLPTAPGRQYYECDINYEGGYRGGERIVFSNDGLIYYSADHYADFELLYE